MGLLKNMTVPLGILFIAGCSSGEPPSPPKPQHAPKTVFDPLTRQMDRARDVQNTVNQNADQTRQAVDNQERGETAP